jgi:DNA-binding response OmpR family regulator
MTLGVVESEEPLLARLIARAFESAGHDCLVFKDADHAAHILRAIRVDSIVLSIQTSRWNGLDWLETVVATWPDLPSRTLLLARNALTSDEANRVRALGAEVVFRSLSLGDVALAVMRRWENVQSARSGLSGRDLEPEISAGRPN